MSGLWQKALLSLVPTQQKGLVKKLAPFTNRSVDDITIPYLIPNNHPRPLTVSDRQRYDITCLVFIKCLSRITFLPPLSVREANSWEQTYPFWNSVSIKRCLWHKYFNEVTLSEAKQIVAREVCDTLYNYIFVKRRDIIGIKVVLYNSSLDKVIDPKVLRDPWFDKEGFNQQKIDKRLLRSWGINTGYKRLVKDELELTVKEGQGRLLQEFDFIKLTPGNLENRLKDIDIDLDYLIKDCLTEAEDSLKRITDRNLRYIIKSKVRNLLLSLNFKNVLTKFLTKKFALRKFRDDFIDSEDKQSAIRTIIESIISDFIDREVALRTKKRAKD